MMWRRGSARAGKYNAQPVTTADGAKHASKKEAARWGQLLLLAKAGQISHLERQVVFPIIVDGRPVKMRNGQVARYTADFVYFEGGERVIEEVKGFVVRDFPLRRALIEHIYHVRIKMI